MPLTPEEIKAIASRAAANAIGKQAQPAETPREKQLRLEGEDIVRQLDNGVKYYAPWLPNGPDGEFYGHMLEDTEVTATAFACKDLVNCKAELINVRKNFKAEPPVFDTKNESHFKTTTDVPFYDAFIKSADYAKSKGYDIKIVEMSPDEYISQVAKMQGTDLTRQLEMVEAGLVKKYADMMRTGTKFDMPYLDLKLGEQEGRARALAAKSLGDLVMPVLMATPTRTSYEKDEDEEMENILCTYADRLDDAFNFFRKKNFSEGKAIVADLMQDEHCSVCLEIIQEIGKLSDAVEKAAGISDLEYHKVMAKLYEKMEWAKAAFCPEEETAAGEDEDESEPD